MKGKEERPLGRGGLLIIGKDKGFDWKNLRREKESATINAWGGSCLMNEILTKEVSKSLL